MIFVNCKLIQKGLMQDYRQSWTSQMLYFLLIISVVDYGSLKVLISAADHEVCKTGETNVILLYIKYIITNDVVYDANATVFFS